MAGIGEARDKKRAVIGIILGVIGFGITILFTVTSLPESLDQGVAGIRLWWGPKV